MPWQPALEDSREELERKVRELSFLEHIVRLSSSAVDHEGLLRTIIDETVEATGTQVCSLYLWDAAEKVLVLTATNGLSQSGIGRVKLGLGEGVTGWVAAQRSPLSIPDVRKEPRFLWVPDLDQERFLSMLSVPIVSRDRVVGVMNVQTVDEHSFTLDEIDFASAIAAQLAGTIEMSALSHRLAKQLDLEREAVSRLRALDESKFNLLTMLSHDFRGPLTIANSYLHGLISRVDGPNREACEEVLAEIQTLEHMVDNVMLSLQTEAQGKLIIDRECFDLVELVHIQAQRMQNTTEAHEIRVTSALQSLPVCADRVKLQAVLTNLLGNAIKYSPDGGPIEARIEKEARLATVSITDHGIGLSERDAEVLFERLGRSENALDRGIAGHGLGLFICRQIIEAHGGHIYARSATEGSLFVFALPLEAAD